MKEEFKAGSSRCEAAQFTAAQFVSRSETLKKTVRAYRKNRVIPFVIMVVGLSITCWPPCSAVMNSGGPDLYEQ